MVKNKVILTNLVEFQLSCGKFIIFGGNIAFSRSSVFLPWKLDLEGGIHFNCVTVSKSFYLFPSRDLDSSYTPLFLLIYMNKDKISKIWSEVCIFFNNIIILNRKSSCLLKSRRFVELLYLLFYFRHLTWNYIHQFCDLL